MSLAIIEQAQSYDVSSQSSSDRYNKNGKFLGTDYGLGINGKTAAQIKDELKSTGLKGRELKRKVNQALSATNEMDRRMVGAIAHLYKAKEQGMLPDKAKYSSKGKLTLTTEEFDQVTNPLNTIRNLDAKALDEVIAAAQARQTALLTTTEESTESDTIDV